MRRSGSLRAVRVRRWTGALAGCCLVIACSAQPHPPETRVESPSSTPAQQSPPTSPSTSPRTADLVPAVPAQGPRPAETGSAEMGPRADFNGDGYGDLAVAKQMRIPGDVDGAGYGLVQVLYGTPDGFKPAASQQWSQADLGGPPGRSSFGVALAHGDFDGDGFSDLVVSDPHDNAVSGGSLQLLYGSAGGLSRARVQQWSLDSSGLPGSAKKGDRFGWALTVGDLGRSSHDDLVIGIPDRNGSGAVLVLFGGSDGVTVEGHQLWDQATEGIPGQAERDDQFGSAVAVGDFDRDRHSELVIGASSDRVSDVHGAGSVYVLRGGRTGPTAAGVQHWTPGRNEIRGYPTDTALFGDALAVGRFTGGDHLDLAIGSPGWNSVDTGGAGAVHVLYGTSDGLTARGNQQWTEYDVGTRGPRDDQPEESPSFGASLVVADFGRGTADDLVISVPEALKPGWASGAVQVIYGTALGLTPAHSRQFSQVTRGIKGFDYDEAMFGSALSVLAPVRADSYPILVVGAPNYGGLDEYARFGIVHLIHGSADGLTAAKDQILAAEEFPQVPVGEQFGWSLTS